MKKISLTDKILLILEAFSYIGIISSLLAISFAFSKEAKLEATILFVPLFILIRCSIEARETRDFRFKLNKKEVLIKKEILDLN